MCRDFATERVGLDVVGEGLRAVDLDHRNQLAVALLELRVAGDVDLPELELDLFTKSCERLTRPFAEVAARSVIEDDFRYGYRPLVVVASATRWTASP